jgi:hypothetical protein
MAVNGFTNIVTDGLVLNLDAGNLKSYPTSGTTWIDLSRNGNNGTLVNMGVTGFSSSNTGIIVFDGVDDYVNCGNILNFEYNNSYTICGWFKFNNDNDSVMLSKQETSGNFRGWTFRKLSNYQLMSGLVNTVTNQTQVRATINAITNNVWYYLCTSYNGNTLASGLKIYINGMETATTVAANVLGSNTIINSSNTQISPLGLQINGNVSNINVYNRVLSASEVLQNYNATKWRFI